MKQRIITAIGIILVVALPVALGGYWLEALALFIVCAGAYEWMHIQPDFKSWPKYVLPLSALAVILTRVLPDKYFFVVMTLIVVFLWSLVVFVENFSIIDAFAFFMLVCLVPAIDRPNEEGSEHGCALIARSNHPLYIYLISRVTQAAQEDPADRSPPSQLIKPHESVRQLRDDIRITSADIEADWHCHQHTAHNDHEQH